MIEFDSIVVQTRCRVRLLHGNRQSFSIDESGEEAKWINISIVNNRLVVYTKPEYYGYLLLYDYYPQITITYKKLVGLQMLEKCFVQSVNTLSLQRLGIVVKYGQLDILVDAFIIDCTVLKNAYATLSGTTIISYVLAYQKGAYDGTELRASEGNVYAYDEAKVSAFFTAEVEIGLSGRSKLFYRDSPSFKINKIDDLCTINKISSPNHIIRYESRENH